MIMTVGAGSAGGALSEGEVRALLDEALRQVDLTGKRLLVIIPDSTRSGPIGLLFRLLHELLRERLAALDFLIALGTHQPLSPAAIASHLGLAPQELERRYAGVRIFNHRWDDPASFCRIGQITRAEAEALSGGLLSLDVPVTINRMIFDYDQLLICGPVFPHEVAGFSGGNKYFFPGIAGQQIIDFTHWLGALITCQSIIGVKQTPVRAAIDRAAALIDRPSLACCYVVRDGGLAGLYLGPTHEAWSRAADLSAQLHILTLDRPFRQVLALMPARYADIWTAAKGMYKLEPVVEDGGELIIYAPHIGELSYTHGAQLDELGYHVRDYFVGQWERFSGYPWGVLAHSTHLRGAGSYQAGVERPRISVTLATAIPPERCRRVGLGYRDPGTLDLRALSHRAVEGLLVVREAGEQLYRLRNGV